MQVSYHRMPTFKKTELSISEKKKEMQVYHTIMPENLGKKIQTLHFTLYIG